MTNINDNNDVSVVVCTKNAAETIDMVMSSVILNNPLEIILVDAKSKDGTIEIARKYNVKVVNDPGIGLAAARNIGLNEVKGKYVFFVGADNILQEDTISKLKKYIIEHDYVGVAALTRLLNRDKNYYAKGSDKRWQLRFYEGTREVIGTPSMFIVSILRQFEFDKSMSWSDDTDLGRRLAEKNYKLGYSNVICYEAGIDEPEMVKRRFKLYGLSDYEYYNKYSQEWTIMRKVKSFLHPLLCEFLMPLLRMKNISEFVYYFPFFAIVTYYRYKGWIEAHSRAI